MAKISHEVCVVIALLAVAHVGWYKLQHKLVPDEQRHEHIAIRMYQHYFNSKEE